MRFTETTVAGAFLVQPEYRDDARGAFARVFCRDEFAAQGLRVDVAQASVAHNHVAGTIRGMHYQAPSAAEAKLVRCTHGAIHDVIVDLRPDSPTYRAHLAVELNAADRIALYVPELCAHGYQTLTDNAEVHYQMSVPHDPESGRGVRYDDPAFGIDWPLDVSVISDKDRAWPDFSQP